MSCGTCTLCCRLLGVTEIQKPKDYLCAYCTVGKGCNIYSERPQTCKDFSCIWLQSQSKEPAARLPEIMRPDRTGVVLSTSTNSENLVAYVDPYKPEAYQRGTMGRFLSGMAKKMQVYVVIGNKRFLSNSQGGK